MLKQCSLTVKKTSFEVRGNALFIVFDNADLDATLKGLIASKFCISGQIYVYANLSSCTRTCTTSS